MTALIPENLEYTLRLQPSRKTLGFAECVFVFCTTVLCNWTIFLKKIRNVLGKVAIVGGRIQCQMLIVDWKVLIFIAVVHKKQRFSETISLRFQRSNRRRSAACGR